MALNDSKRNNAKQMNFIRSSNNFTIHLRINKDVQLIISAMHSLIKQTNRKHKKEK